MKSLDKPVVVEGIKKTVFGREAVDEIGAECKWLGAKRALLVIDQQLSATETLANKTLDEQSATRIPEGSPANLS